MLRHVFLATLFSATMISGVQAADFEAPPAGFDWTGFYIGGHVGYGEPSFDGIFDISESDGSEGTPLPEETTYVDDLDNADGFVAGGQAGYNHQSGNALLGIEADISFTDFKGDVADNEGNDVVEVDMDYLASLRLRIGYVVDRVVFYGTGGVAYASGEFKIIDDKGTSDQNSGKVDIDAFGGVAGGGVEWALIDSVSVRVEGLYYIFNDAKNANGVTDDSDPRDFVEVEDVGVVRGGINILF